MTWNTLCMFPTDWMWVVSYQMNVFEIRIIWKKKGLWEFNFSLDICRYCSFYYVKAFSTNNLKKSIQAGIWFETYTAVLWDCVYIMWYWKTYRVTHYTPDRESRQSPTSVIYLYNTRFRGASCISWTWHTMPRVYMFRSIACDVSVCCCIADSVNTTDWLVGSTSTLQVSKFSRVSLSFFHTPLSAIHT